MILTKIWIQVRGSTWIRIRFEFFLLFLSPFPFVKILKQTMSALQSRGKENRQANVLFKPLKSGNSVDAYGKDNGRLYLDWDFLIIKIMGLN